MSGGKVVVDHDPLVPLVGKVVSQNDLTEIVVGVTVSLSARISPRSAPERNARTRTVDTIVVF